MSEQRYGWDPEEGFFVDTLLTDKEGSYKQLPREEVLEILNSRAALEAKLEATTQEAIMFRTRLHEVEAKLEVAEGYANEGWAWVDEICDRLGLKDVFEIRERYPLAVPKEQKE